MRRERLPSASRCTDANLSCVVTHMSCPEPSGLRVLPTFMLSDGGSNDKNSTKNKK